MSRIKIQLLFGDKTTIFLDAKNAFKSNLIRQLSQGSTIFLPLENANRVRHIFEFHSDFFDGIDMSIPRMKNGGSCSLFQYLNDVRILEIPDLQEVIQNRILSKQRQEYGIDKIRGKFRLGKIDPKTGKRGEPIKVVMKYFTLTLDQTMFIFPHLDELPNIVYTFFDFARKIQNDSAMIPYVNKFKIGTSLNLPLNKINTAVLQEFGAFHAFIIDEVSWKLQRNAFVNGWNKLKNEIKFMSSSEIDDRYYQLVKFGYENLFKSGLFKNVRKFDVAKYFWITVKDSILLIPDHKDIRYVFSKFTKLSDFFFKNIEISYRTKLSRNDFYLLEASRIRSANITMVMKPFTLQEIVEKYVIHGDYPLYLNLSRRSIHYVLFDDIHPIIEVIKDKYDEFQEKATQIMSEMNPKNWLSDDDLVGEFGDNYMKFLKNYIIKYFSKKKETKIMILLNKIQHGGDKYFPFVYQNKIIFLPKHKNVLWIINLFFITISNKYEEHLKEPQKKKFRFVPQSIVLAPKLTTQQQAIQDEVPRGYTTISRLMMDFAEQSSKKTFIIQNKQIKKWSAIWNEKYLGSKFKIDTKNELFYIDHDTFNYEMIQNLQNVVYNESLKINKMKVLFDNKVFFFPHSGNWKKGMVEIENAIIRMFDILFTNTIFRIMKKISTN